MRAKTAPARAQGLGPGKAQGPGLGQGPGQGLASTTSSTPVPPKNKEDRHNYDKDKGQDKGQDQGKDKGTSGKIPKKVSAGGAKSGGRANARTPADSAMGIDNSGAAGASRASGGGKSVRSSKPGKGGDAQHGKVREE